MPWDISHGNYATCFLLHFFFYFLKMQCTPISFFSSALPKEPSLAVCSGFTEGRNFRVTELMGFLNSEGTSWVTDSTHWHNTLSIRRHCVFQQFKLWDLVGFSTQEVSWSKIQNCYFLLHPTTWACRCVYVSVMKKQIVLHKAFELLIASSMWYSPEPPLELFLGRLK